MGRQPGGDRGFTLLEVLVAIAVLALLTLAFAALARTVGDTTARLNEGAKERDLLLATRAFLRRELGRARGWQWGPTPLFLGTRERLRFAALAPSAQHAIATVYEIELRSEGSGSALWLRFAALPPRADPMAVLAAAPWRRTIVVDGRLELAYYGRAREDDARGWYPETRMLRGLPEAVRLIAVDAREGWPALLVRTPALHHGPPAATG